MLIAKSDQLIGIVKKLVEEEHILKSGKGVPVAATSLIATISPIAATSFVASTPPPAARVPVDATPLVGATPLATATPSYANTLNIPTNDNYWYNYNEGDGVPNDGNDGY